MRQTRLRAGDDAETTARDDARDVHPPRGRGRDVPDALRDELFVRVPLLAVFVRPHPAHGCAFEVGDDPHRDPGDEEARRERSRDLQRGGRPQRAQVHVDRADARADVHAHRREHAADDAAHERGGEELVHLAAVEHDEKRERRHPCATKVPRQRVRGEPQRGGEEVPRHRPLRRGADHRGDLREEHHPRRGADESLKDAHGQRRDDVPHLRQPERDPRAPGVEREARRAHDVHLRRADQAVVEERAAREQRAEREATDLDVPRRAEDSARDRARGRGHDRALHARAGEERVRAGLRHRDARGGDPREDVAADVRLRYPLRLLRVGGRIIPPGRGRDRGGDDPSRRPRVSRRGLADRRSAERARRRGGRDRDARGRAEERAIARRPNGGDCGGRDIFCSAARRGADASVRSRAPLVANAAARDQRARLRDGDGRHLERDRRRLVPRRVTKHQGAVGFRRSRRLLKKAKRAALFLIRSSCLVRSVAAYYSTRRDECKCAHDARRHSGPPPTAPGLLNAARTNAIRGRGARVEARDSGRRVASFAFPRVRAGSVAARAERPIERRIERARVATTGRGARPKAVGSRGI
eukprot:30612-Pelagococcus_subviridis.AAC.28